MSISVTIQAEMQHPLSPEKLKSAVMSEVGDSLLEFVQARYRQLSRANYAALNTSQMKLGDMLYLPISRIQLGQPDLDFANSISKALQAIEKEWVNWDDGQYQLITHSGASVFPKEKCGTGVVVGDTVLLIDGHSKAMASLYLGADHLCVKIVDSFLDARLQDESTLQMLENKGYLLRWNRLGQKMKELPTWESVRNIPLRSVITAHRIKAEAKISASGKVKELRIQSGDPETAVFFQINKEPAFVAVLLSIVARIGGYKLDDLDPLAYEPSEQNTNYLIQSIERGLTSGHPAIGEMVNLPRIPLITHHKQVESKERMIRFLESHYEKLRCYNKLKP